MKIKRMTPEQAEYLPIFRKMYLDKALNPKRINRDALQSAINDAYAEIGESSPVLVLCDSPLQCLLTMWVLKGIQKAEAHLSDNLGDNLGANLSDNLRDNLRAPLWNNLTANLSDNLSDNLWANLLGNLRDNLWANLETNLGDTLLGNLMDNLEDNLRANLRANLRDNLMANLRDNLWDDLSADLRANLRDNLLDTLWDNLWDNLSANLWSNLEANLRANLEDNLSADLRANLRDNLVANLWANLWDNLRANLRDHLWANLRDNLRDNLGDTLLANLSANLGANLEANLETPIWDSGFLWGSQDYYWIAWSRFAQHIGVRIEEIIDYRLGIFERIGAECEWWWPYKGIVFASQKPVTKWDDRGRLHCIDGPAIQYADGYQIHAYHGVVIPADWITNPESLTARAALTWENMEQRRAACELKGWHNILAELDCRVIDRDENPQIGELVEVTLPDVGAERFLRVMCGTGREFALCVTRFGHKTARECNAATYGWTPDEPIENFIPVTRT